MKHRLLLVILDGWGINKKKLGNAIANATTVNYDFYMNNYPHSFLKASGLDVGLPGGQMGNSEVGHLNIGAGRIVYQEMARITKSIQDLSFFDNVVLLDAIRKAKSQNSTLHLMGLASDGGVHSLLEHLYALLKLAKQEGIKKLCVHVITDGRDVPPKSAQKYIREIENAIKKIKIGEIATVSGRYYAMDRDKRWERVQKYYDALVNGKGLHNKTAEDAIAFSYKRNQTDEFIEPTVIGDFKGVQSKDSIIFFNFRSDRAREIMWAFTQKDFSGFPRKNIEVYFTCMCEYDNNAMLPVAFPPEKLNNTLGEVISAKGISQFRIAETEKYAHVTFFFNGGIEKPNKNEERLLISSPKVATYDLKPEMSAYEVKDEAIKAIQSDKYGFMVLNFANPDMVGHTGIYEAAVKAINAVDACLGKVVDAARKKDFVVLITADHGNAEQMIDYKTNAPFTSHTTNPVPFIIVGKDCNLRNGILADIAPTILELMKIQKPKEMTGKSLILKKA